MADDRTASAVPADTSGTAGTAPSGACEGGVALAPDVLAAGRAARPEPASSVPEDSEPAAAEPVAVPPVLAVPPVPLTPAFQMLGSDDVGVCVDGVCAVPAPSSAPVPTTSTAGTEQD